MKEFSQLLAWHKNAKRRYVPHAPTGKQREFLALTCLEALYGGAAGGGKSDALLMAFFGDADDPSRYVKQDGYSGLILRRTYTDLALDGAIMDRADEWLRGTDATWDDRDKRWTFPSGARLTFGYLESEADKFRYQSAEFQYIGFDEETQFTETQYRYMFSRLRRTVGVDVPLRMRGATNPGNIGHEWVKRRFVDEETRGDRVFIPATLNDNPHLDADEYRKSLAELDSATRAQLERGVWIREAGGLVYQLNDELNLVDELPERDDWRYGLSIDYGFSNETAFSEHAWSRYHPVHYVTWSEKTVGLTPSVAAQRTKDLDEARGGYDWIVGDVGGLGKGYAEEARRQFRLPIRQARKNDKRGYIDLFNGAMQDGRLKLIKGRCRGLVAEMRELPWDKVRKSEMPGFPNHECDSALYGWREGRSYAAEEKEEKPAVGTPEHAALIEKQWEERLLGELQRKKLSRATPTERSRLMDEMRRTKMRRLS